MKTSVSSVTHVPEIAAVWPKTIPPTRVPGPPPGSSREIVAPISTTRWSTPSHAAASGADAAVDVSTSDPRMATETKTSPARRKIVAVREVSSIRWIDQARSSSETRTRTSSRSPAME